jgi:hypothetical protein
MKIHNPNNLPVIDYRSVKPLQGKLKELTPPNRNKLLRVLSKRGFTTPLFLWKSGDDFFLMDGHQRQRVMIQHDLNDEGNYNVPYILIEAASEADAKAQLLEITSQYGTVTEGGLASFLDGLDNTLLGDINFDALDVDRLMAGNAAGAQNSQKPDAANRSRMVLELTAEEQDVVSRAIIKCKREVDLSAAEDGTAAAVAFIARQFIGE